MLFICFGSYSFYRSVNIEPKVNYIQHKITSHFIIHRNNLIIGFTSRNSELDDSQSDDTHMAVLNIPVWIDETPASWEPKIAPLMTKWAEVTSSVFLRSF